MKIALVHDFLKEYGGAERVLEVMHEIWPEAPIYTAFVDWEGLGPHSERLKKWIIKVSWAQKIPFITKIFSPLRFLAPMFFESFNFNGFDLVISSTNAYYAKGVLTQPETVHICYCHTPPRSLYGYATRMDWQKNFLTRLYGTMVNHYLRKYDYLSAQRVDYFIANSKVVKDRIEKFYRRDSTVIYPPVDLSLRAKRSNPVDSNYYLYVGKLAVAKNVNLAIEAACKMHIKLKIVGKGPLDSDLRQNDIYNYVEFLGEISDEELTNLYAGCKAVIFPAVDEDFGIVPVEAMSFGKPVIAFRSGGVVETVVDGKTGVFFDKPTTDSLIAAIKKLDTIKIKGEDCIKQANKFSKDVFKAKIVEFVDKTTSEVLQ